LRRLENAITHGTVQRGRTGLVIVVDDVVEAVGIAAVHGTVTPVEQHIVHEIEIVGHRHAGIAASVAGEKIMMKAGVITAPIPAESVIINIQRLTADGPLDRDIDGRQFERRPAGGRLIHVTIGVDVLVIAPARRAMVDDDVAHGISIMSTMPVEYI
jgi:hypothetical protein